MNPNIFHTKRWSINFWRIGGFLLFLLFLLDFQAPKGGHQIWWCRYGRKPRAHHSRRGHPGGHGIETGNLAPAASDEGVDTLGAKTIGVCKFVLKNTPKKQKVGFDLTTFCVNSELHTFLCIYICVYRYTVYSTHLWMNYVPTGCRTWTSQFWIVSVGPESP